jgi:putative transposase
VGVRFPRATRQVVISIAGEQHWLWRAVDQNGFVLDVLVQRRRDSRAVQQLMRRLLKSAVTSTRVMITDKLRSYGAARAKMGLRVEHRQHKGLNNRLRILINRPGGANGS